MELSEARISSESYTGIADPVSLQGWNLLCSLFMLWIRVYHRTIRDTTALINTDRERNLKLVLLALKARNQTLLPRYRAFSVDQHSSAQKTILDKTVCACFTLAT